MSTRLKVGIVGTGHGLRTIAPALLSSAHFDIVAVAGSSIPRTQEILNAMAIDADAVNFEQIINIDDIDLLCIASPNELYIYILRSLSEIRDLKLQLLPKKWLSAPRIL
jgi:predicted dehydrogenase